MGHDLRGGGIRKKRGDNRASVSGSVLKIVPHCCSLRKRIKQANYKFKIEER